VMGFVAIAEYLSGQARAVGYSGDANFFASLQVVALPLAAVLAGQARTGRARAVYLLGLAVIAGSVLTSLSRGGILGLVGVFMLLALQPARGFFRTRARKTAFLVAMTAGSLALLAVSYGALSARTSSLFNSADGGSGRTNLWRAAQTGFEEHPIRGLGFGAFPSQSNDLLRRTPGVDFSAYNLRPDGQVVHNAYLESLVELGVVGLALFLAVLTATWLTLRRSAAIAVARDELYLSSVARALIISLAGFAFTSIFLSTETDRTLWVLMGLALALARVLAGKEPSTP
jgi:O-antigen ligase